eukprot:9036000-Ditylum_brightwellii.AAC.1
MRFLPADKARHMVLMIDINCCHDGVILFLITQRSFNSSQEASCCNRAEFYRIYKFVNINFSKVRSHAG